MNVDDFAAAYQIVLPLVSSAVEIARGLLSQITDAKTALSQLRGLLDVTRTRIEQYDAKFAARDASEDARVAAESVLHDPNK